MIDKHFEAIRLQREHLGEQSFGNSGSREIQSFQIHSIEAFEEKSDEATRYLSRQGDLSEFCLSSNFQGKESSVTTPCGFFPVKAMATGKTGEKRRDV